MTDFPLICSEAINKYGDVLAVVAADTREHAREAAKKVKPNIEVLPAYETYPEAVVPNALQLHKTIPNFYMEQPLLKGEDTADIFDDAPIVVESSFHSQHEPHLPIESDIVQAYWDADGKMTIQSKTQNLSESLGSIAPAIGLKPEQLRFIMNPAGGAFGYTIVANMMGITAACAMALDMPVSHELSYDEFNHTSGKRAATWTNGRIAVDDNGKIAAVEYDMACDHGCYAGSAPMIFDNFISVGFHGYNIPNAKALARGGSSNSAFGTAYRGFGAPQVYTTTEALVDMAARKAGIDPWQFRYDNVARPGDTTLCSREYSEYPYPGLLEKIKPYYDEYKKLAEEGRAAGKHMGCGISLGGFHLTTGAIDWAEVDLELLPDGCVRLYDTWEDVGQGGDIGSVTHVVKALAPLGITADQVKLTMNDFSADKEKTVCPDMGLAAASRCHYMGGNAIIDAANKLMDAMRKEDGTFRTYDEMVAEGIATKYRGHYDQFNAGLDHGLDPNTGEGHKSPTYMYTVNTCLVDVDVNTGKTKVLKYTCASDVGVIGNKLAVDGQAYGGLSHSIGFALSEDYYGDKKHGNMVGCGIPTIDVIPDDFNLIYQETYRKHGPHGSAGCSEGYQSSGHMAVINAIDDACGVRVTILPATPDKVKAGWAKVQAGEDQTPPKYFLGSDFEDEMELIAANPM